MASSTAWLLPLNDGLTAAVGEYEILHLLHFPALFKVPGAPYYCQNVLVWQNQILPAFDLAAWLHQEPKHQEQKLIAIAAYEDINAESDTTSYAGLLLADIPQQTVVDDEQACDLPDQPANWEKIAISCFKRDDRAIPIIDLQTIFSGALLQQS